MSLYLKHGGKTLSTGIKEAPDDGKLYSRKDKKWIEVTIPEVDIKYPPSDDKLYGIKNEEWKEVVIPEIEISSDDFVPSIVKILTDDIDEESGLPTGEQSLQPKSTISHTENEGLKYKSNVSNNNIIIREKSNKSDLEIIVNGQQFENWLSGKLVSSVAGNAIMKHASDNKLYAKITSVANRQRFNTSGTFTVPETGTMVITVSGGGGGGGGGASGAGGREGIYDSSLTYFPNTGNEPVMYASGYPRLSNEPNYGIGPTGNGGTGGTTTVKIGSTVIASAVGGGGGSGAVRGGYSGTPAYKEGDNCRKGTNGASGISGTDGTNGTVGSGLIADVPGGIPGYGGSGGYGGGERQSTTGAGGRVFGERGGSGGSGGYGGAGGKGGKQRIVYNVTKGQILTVTIGAGGPGGSGSQSTGSGTGSAYTVNGIRMNGFSGSVGNNGGSGDTGYVELEW